MPSFNLHNLTTVLSPRAALRRRRNNSTSSSRSMSSVSSTSSIRSMNSTSNVSIASSSESRRSSESIFSSTTNATSHGDSHEHKLPVSSVPMPAFPKRSYKPAGKKPSSVHATLRPRSSTVDLYGFHMIDDAEETFTPELVILEPRPAVRFDGVLETLDQANALPFLMLKL